MISRMALVKAIPGTRAIRAPMMIRSMCCPKPNRERAMASKAETMPPAMVLKNKLAPSRVIKLRQIPMAAPHSPPHRASLGEPPKKTVKAAAPKK